MVTVNLSRKKKDFSKVSLDCPLQGFNMTKSEKKGAILVCYPFGKRAGKPS